MKNLIVVRHAKSSWATPTKDVDRPLIQRGISDAHLVSSCILNSIPKTFLLWTSTAKRASDTAIIFAQNIAFPIENIIYKEDLYTFDENQLEKVIKSCNNLYESIILFGHNPTSGLVSLQFETDDWSKIDKGKTQKIIFPKDLK